MNNLLKDKAQILWSVVSYLGLYLVVAGLSWLIFGYFKGPILKSEPTKVSNLEGSRSKITGDQPRTEVCSINGGKFTKIEKSIWSKRRPITAIIENHADSRPPEGLSKADIVYEAVAEGGITRFLGIFYCGASGYDIKIAPVRSARIYFIDWASEYADKPIFLHVGGANNYGGSGDTAKEVRALETLETIGWRVPKGNDFDTTYDSGFPIFWRNPDRLTSVLGHPLATEHTMTASLDSAYEEAAKRGFTDKDKKGSSWDRNFVPWKFVDDKSVDSPSATSISFEFWKNAPLYNVVWKYNKEENKYLRENGGVAHVDFEFDKAQISAKNVVVIKVKERGSVDRNKHVFYTTTGTGKALFFMNGEMFKGSWEKKSRESRTKFYKEDRSEVSFVRGQIWIEAIPDTNEVLVQ